MPDYVYRCPKCGVEEIHHHSIAECDTIRVFCNTCVAEGGGNVECHRVPQPFRWGRSSWDILGERFDEGWQNFKRKEALKKKFGTYQKSAPYKDYENINGEVVEMKR